MGHINAKKVYADLQKRLDGNVVGAPSHEKLFDILKHMYSEDEARIASLMPMTFAPAAKIAARVRMPVETVKPILDRMADRGLVFDSERDGKAYYMMAPTVVGFFEFTMMRVRDDIDQKYMAGLLHDYMYTQEDFARSAFREDTQIGRALVHENTLSGDDLSEILPYEKASDIVADASAIAVGMCYCRHKQHHMGKDCKFPMDVCMSLNYGADFIVRHKFGRPIDKKEASDILVRNRELGLVHVGDNVQKRMTYICSCCGCCCGMLMGINTLGIHNAVMTSNFIAAIAEEKCHGCGRCARRCPVGAISLTSVQGKAYALTAAVDEEKCMGCGVCHAACRKDALTMDRRPARVMTPESTIHRVLQMALERGKLQNLIFDENAGYTAKTLNTVVGAILNLPVVKRKLAEQQLKSRFISFLAAGVKRTTQPDIF